MREILNETIGLVGPFTVCLLIFMTYYLWFNKAITFGQFIFPLFWPEIVFRFRDYTEKYNSKLKFLYYIFWLNVVLLVVGISSELLRDLKEIPVPALVFILLVLFLFMPMIAYVLYLSSKEKYY